MGEPYIFSKSYRDPRHCPRRNKCTLACSCMSTLSNKELTPGIYPQPCGKHHGDNPTTSKMTFDNIKKVILANEQNSFHLSEETRFRPSWGVPQIWLWSVFEATIDTTIMQTSLSLTTPIKIEWWLTIPISRDNRLCHCFSYNIVENETHFVLECPLYNPISDKFQYLFTKASIGSLRSFSPSSHQLGISIYLMEATALRHSRKLVGLTPP
jgi:hypothetical protein